MRARSVGNLRQAIQSNARRKKFYFAGAIRGNISYEKNFYKIIEIIKEYGEPLTERSNLYNPLDKNFSQKERTLKEKRIYRRDIIQWLGKSSALIAEISGASTGVGYEIHYATRNRRIPVLCLYNASSTPTLVVKQDPSKYILLQQYSDENDLERYLRCFLIILTKTEDIEDIRSIYIDVSNEIAKSSLSIQETGEIIEKLLTFGDSAIIQKDLTNIHVAKFKPVDIDFKDSASFVKFMFRNIILQRRWEQLKSQRIGTTFVSGRKRRIITALSAFKGPTNLLEIYHHAGEDKLQYTQEAFTKNVRAYRKIGLFDTPTKAEYKTPRLSTTKFRDRLILIRTLQGDITVESSRSPREILRKLIVVTRHLQHLSMFIRKFGSKPLVRLLIESKKELWFSKIVEIPILNIDKVDINQHREDQLIEQVTTYLYLKCKDFWKKQYSSFA